MNSKKSDYPINSLILKRWSPRAMSGESITKDDLMAIFEAARWAPSSYNNQPWKFIYAMRDTPEWKTILNLLIEFNQNWCKNAAVLIVIISKNNFDYNNKNSRTHAFDTGSAWENLALQATHMNLVSHGMEGFDYNRAKKELAIPDDFTVEAMCAIGKPGKKENLSEDLQEKEMPSGRKPITEFVFNGKFGSPTK